MLSCPPVDFFHGKGAANELAQFVRAIYRVVSTTMTELWWNKVLHEKRRNKRSKNKKNRKNENNSRFCHFPVSYLAGVIEPIDGPARFAVASNISNGAAILFWWQS